VKNKSRAFRDPQLSFDQRDEWAQFTFVVLFWNRDGSDQNNSLPAHSLRLSADHPCADAQFDYTVLLSHREWIAQNKSLAARCSKVLADRGQQRLKTFFVLSLSLVMALGRTLICPSLSADQRDEMLNSLLVTCFSMLNPASRTNPCCSFFPIVG
jgi:hypothetical protein